MPPSSSFRAHAAARLRSRSKDLTERWLQAVRARLPESPRRVFPGESLLDHIPQVLDKLCESIDRDEPPTDMEFVRRDLDRLASLRRSQGYGVDEILVEFDLLREVLFDALAEEVMGHGEPVDAGEAVTVAVRLQHLAGEMGRVTGRYYASAGASERVARSELLTRFGRAVAHELRNRLHTAQLALEVVAGHGDDPAKRVEALETLRHALDKTSSVVSDVFAVAVAHDHESAVETRREPLSTLVRSTIADVAEHAESRGVDVAVDGELPDFQVDASRVHLVLVNLLTNAIKYSDGGKPHRRVRVRAGRTGAGGTWRVDVVDNGLGIPPEMQQTIFREGVRHSGETDLGGEGLGLDLARRAVEQMGGRIWLDSEPGKGSTFSFTVDEPAADF